MSYILTIILFNGVISAKQYSTAQECQMALYSAMDELFIKNIETIECAEATKKNF